MLNIVLCSFVASYDYDSGLLMRLNLSLILAVFSGNGSATSSSRDEVRSIVAPDSVPFIRRYAPMGNASGAEDEIIDFRPRQLVRNGPEYVGRVMFGNLPLVEKISHIGKDVILGFENDSEKIGYISTIWFFNYMQDPLKVYTPDPSFRRGGQRTFGGNVEYGDCESPERMGFYSTMIHGRNFEGCRRVYAPIGSMEGWGFRMNRLSEFEYRLPNTPYYDEVDAPEREGYISYVNIGEHRRSKKSAVRVFVPDHIPEAELARNYRFQQDESASLPWDIQKIKRVSFAI